MVKKKGCVVPKHTSAPWVWDRPPALLKHTCGPIMPSMYRTTVG
eukprot:COSAG06_NODE_26488_length_613_cov_3.869650_2_plen_43_part_01